MAEATAGAQLARILEILPHAARAEGVALAELAEALGAEEREIVKDLQEICTRAFYQPSGGGDGIQVTIEPDRVQVWTTGEFRRPVRLNVRETLALDLGLRMLAAESPLPGRGELLALASRLEAALSAEGAEALIPHIAVDAPSGDAAVRAAVAEAARSRRRCEIAYLKRSSSEPERREIEPYALLIADGRTYVVARCRRADDERVFRLDRMMEARVLSESFEPPADFDPHEWTDGGRVFRADEAPTLSVRYSPRIARWLREQGPVQEMEDGSVVVRYPLADADWAVAHVLRHGADAEVLEPPEVRRMVAEAASGIA